MNLILDIGNTLTKVAVFDEEKLIEESAFKKFTAQVLQELIHRHKITHSISSSVKMPEPWLDEMLQNQTKYLKFNDKLKLPVKNKYKSPETLGNDRLASAAGAAKLFPGKNILIFDAGTCLKTNFVTTNAEFAGGSISPGIQMRLKALHHFTDKLPLLSLKEINFLTGTTTEESILSGVINGMAGEIEFFIKNYSEKYPGLISVITGGDVQYLLKFIKNEIFAAPNLVTQGLNEILLYNLH